MSALLSRCDPRGSRLRQTDRSPPPGTLTGTHSLVRQHRAAAVLQPAGIGLAVVFEDRQDPMLPSPTPPLPRDVQGHGKTIVGLDIARSGAGISLRRTSARLRAAGKSMVAPAPTAKAAGILVCRSLGIVKDGEDVTANVLHAFAERFKDQLPQEVLSAMREMFKLDDSHATTVEDTLIQHGGEGAMNIERMEDAAAAIQGSI
ncbi:hypothetical protein ZWY2020_051854 [Hordeum vulgare]|nr:hypothetical protein ZWY2020_051854 [Hordeum vulgare]